MFSETHFIFRLFETNFVFVSFFVIWESTLYLEGVNSISLRRALLAQGCTRIIVRNELCEVRRTCFRYPRANIVLTL